MKRIYVSLLSILFISLLLAIILNVVLEIGYDIKGSPYARFIVKGGNSIYDFLTNYGLNIAKAIIYLVLNIVFVSLILTIISLISIAIYKDKKYIVSGIIAFLIFIISISLTNNIFHSYNRIYKGASYFHIYYLILTFLIFVFIGLQFSNRLLNHVKYEKHYLFNFKESVHTVLSSSFISLILLYTGELIYSLIKNYKSILSWQDIIFTALATFSIAFYLSLFHFVAILLFFYITYIVYKSTIAVSSGINLELFVFISSFFTSIVTILVIYYWGFNYIRNQTPIFGFIPALSLSIILYSFATYPIAYLLMYMLKNADHPNIIPLSIVSSGLGWTLALPITILCNLLFRNKTKIIKIIYLCTLLLCIFIGIRIIFSLYNEKYLSHAYVVHYIAGRYLIIVAIFTAFIFINFFNLNSILKKMVSLKLLVLYFFISIIGYISLGVKENVRFLLIRKTDIISSGIKTLRFLSDLDRDEFSYFFCGGDKSEFNKKDNPYYKNYFVVDEENIDTSNNLKTYKLNNNRCNMTNKLKFRNKPNLIFILFDGGRKDMFGTYGNKDNLTPNVDKFAKESIVFKNAYSNTSLSIVYDNIFFTGHYGAKNNERKMPYHHFIEILCNKGVFSYHIFPYYWTNFKMCKNVSFIDENTTYKYQINHKKPIHTSSVTFDTFFDLLDTHNIKNSLFSYLFLFDTHFPFDENWEGGKFFGHNMMSIYKNHISYADNNFGTFIEGLKKRNLYDNSIIIVFADHGSELKEHGRVYHGYHLYSESVNIPFIVKIPGVKPKVIETPFSTVDFLPTILNILGICDKSTTFDGIDFSGVISEEFDTANADRYCQHDSWFCKLGPSDTIKNDMIFMYDGIEDRYALLYNNKYKLIYNRTENVFELYDLQDDPKEVRNIADKEKDIFEKLKYILFDFLYKGFHIYGDVSIFKKVPEQ